ncbi:hypothetical protein COCNU_08G006510 [Cocos nucifera]|uniref:DUF4283 domain-containing protein n=1 Tax=Cocos nucifera TaxID=13894 RepID=A0A8K0N6B1_COCNU|nr:hypothetical protein COCNU_08G006510 [Cocos nucifera]
MVASWKEWENVAIFIRSIGRQVPLDWVAKEVKDKCKLEYEPETFAMAEDHYLLRFREAVDCKAALRGGPWFVVGQLLAMERRTYSGSPLSSRISPSSATSAAGWGTEDRTEVEERDQLTAKVDWP